ncbi:MAG: nicotinate-nucleotide diphosphorylase [Gemmataceae bacterium]|nr:nicotinate-nucleotide diphosphorylase [Gemmataceae bacterium]
MFTPQETTACEKLIALALAEDLGDRGDLTSQEVIPADLHGSAVVVVKTPGVLAGLPAAQLVMAAIDPRLSFERLKDDGDRVAAGDRVAKVAGSMRSILSAERTALNFVQHLSGVATLTRRYMDAVAGLPVKVLDTRKTLPGWRLLAKYAVRQGGGHNHRLGLYDGILIKDNHLAALPVARDAIQAQLEEIVALAKHEAQRANLPPEAVAGLADHLETTLKFEETVRTARARFPDLPVEIEVDSVQQAAVALMYRPAIVLLDNMPPPQLREAVRFRNQLAPKVLLEASGGITLETIRAVAETGVDRISVGALTHSAPALDVSLEYQA